MPKVKIKVSGEDTQQGLPGTGTKAEKWERDIMVGESFTEVRIACEAIAKVRPKNHLLQVQKADKDGNWVTKFEVYGSAEKAHGRPEKPADPDKPKKEPKAKKLSVVK